MTAKLACLRVRSPDERAWMIELVHQRITVGRTAPGSRPDVPLDPDPQQWVSRLHCMLESQEGTWWLSDNGTVNGTFLRREATTDRVTGRVRLQDGDVICILGDMTSAGTPLYWELALVDPFGTRDALAEPAQPSELELICLEYDMFGATLYQRQGTERVEVSNLAPLAHKLIRYMADRSLKNGGSPVACTYEELIRAVWGERHEWPAHRAYTPENVRDLVSDLRQRLEPDPKNPRLLQAVKGFGYRLILCPPAP